VDTHLASFSACSAFFARAGAGSAVRAAPVFGAIQQDGNMLERAAVRVNEASRPARKARFIPDPFRPTRPAIDCGQWGGQCLDRRQAATPEVARRDQ
jgi:hypothetical protein